MLRALSLFNKNTHDQDVVKGETHRLKKNLNTIAGGVSPSFTTKTITV